MLDEKTYEEWDKAAFLARQGDPASMAEFLRKHSKRWPEIDLDLAKLADLLKGKLGRGRGKPSAATKKARAEDLILRAADGDRDPLIGRLESLHIEHYTDVPHFRLL